MAATWAVEWDGVRYACVNRDQAEAQVIHLRELGIYAVIVLVIRGAA